MTLRFRDLPGFSMLFVDYAEGAERLRRILPWRVDAEALRSCAARVQMRNYPRAELADQLARQAKQFGSGFPVLASIEKLRNSAAVAVTASVAPGLLGGLLSAWFKALTTARLAAWLSDQGTPAVPILFLRRPAGRECIDLGLLSRRGPTRLELENRVGRPAEIPPEIEILLIQVTRVLEIGIEESDILVALRDAYMPRGEFKTAWAQFMSHMFESLGLILFDPSQSEVQSLLRCLLPPEQEHILTALYTQRENLLHAGGYEDSHLVQAPDHAGQSLEMSTLQSLLFPTAAQVIASAEVHPFVCGQAAYAGLNSVPPVGWPCVSASLVNSHSRKILGRLGLPFQHLFAGTAALTGRLMQQVNSPEIVDRLEELKSELSSGIAELNDLVPAEDRLRKAVIRTGQRMSYQIEKLKSRSCHAQQRRRDVRERQLARICADLAPWGRRQEEEFAAFQFPVRHKDARPDHLYEIIDPWKFEHQLIWMD